MRHSKWIARWLTACTLLPACGGDEPPAAPVDAGPEASAAQPYEPPSLVSDCDPLVPEHCLLPFPSNVWLKEEAGLPGGYRIRFGDTTLALNQNTGNHGPADLLAGFDGFSTGNGPMTYLPGATYAGLPSPVTLEDSLGTDSPSILLDTRSGELVPHWVEIDAWGGDGDAAIQIRPAVRLQPATRYIAAFRGVLDASGAAIPPSPAFRALRDGQAGEDADIEGRRRFYDTHVFPLLEEAGVDRASLQIAWDFTTGTDENIQQKLVAMRDRALAEVGELGPELTFKERLDPANAEHLEHSIIVTMEVPLYLTSAEYRQGGPIPDIVLDDEGLPLKSGTMQHDVIIHVPKSAASGDKHGLLQNGHGLLGSFYEGRSTFLARYANEFKYITFQTAFFGFASDDEVIAGEALAARPALGHGFVARQHQGMVMQLLAMRMMMGRVARDGIRDDEGNVLLDGSAIDPSVRAYRGDSQGGIMGGTYVALSTDVQRGLLGQTGMPYSALFFRFDPWPRFNDILEFAYDDARDRKLVMELTQVIWDQTEPNGYVHTLADGSLPGTPKSSVLIHNAIGDHQVTTFGGHILARAAGARLLENDEGRVARDVFGLERARGPLTDESALVEFDFGLAPEPRENVAATDGCDPHDRVRELTPAFVQSDRYFRTGEIRWDCDGLCSCEGADPDEDQCGFSFLRECCRLDEFRGRPPRGREEPVCPP